MTDDDFTTVELELDEPIVEQVDAAAELVGVTPDEFMETAILGRLQAVDNILHGDTHVPLPPDFDPEAWRERYEHIRRLDTDYADM